MALKIFTLLYFLLCAWWIINISPGFLANIFMSIVWGLQKYRVSPERFVLASSRCLRKYRRKYLLRHSHVRLVEYVSFFWTIYGRLSNGAWRCPVLIPGNLWIYNLITQEKGLCEWNWYKDSELEILFSIIWLGPM